MLRRFTLPAPLLAGPGPRPADGDENGLLSIRPTEERIQQHLDEKER